LSTADAVSRAMFVAKAKVAAAMVGAVLALGTIAAMVGNYVIAPWYQRQSQTRPEQHTSAMDVRIAGESSVHR
jgi:hypothetical protein